MEHKIIVKDKIKSQKLIICYKEDHKITSKGEIYLNNKCGIGMQLRDRSKNLSIDKLFWRLFQRDFS